MSKVSVSSQTVKAQLMKDKAFEVEYDRLKPRYDVISQIIAERQRQNITQEELANRIGTKKSNVSRFESGNYNPSLDFLAKIAEALGKELELSLTSLS